MSRPPPLPLQAGHSMWHLEWLPWRSSVWLRERTLGSPWAGRPAIFSLSSIDFPYYYTSDLWPALKLQ